MSAKPISVDDFTRDPETYIREVANNPHGSAFELVAPSGRPLCRVVPVPPGPVGADGPFAAPATNVDHKPWRREPPDLLGYWWMRRAGCPPFCCLLATRVQLMQTARGWALDWRCCPEPA